MRRPSMCEWRPARPRKGGLADADLFASDFVYCASNRCVTRPQLLEKRQINAIRHIERLVADYFDPDTALSGDGVLLRVFRS